MNKTVRRVFSVVVLVFATSLAFAQEIWDDVDRIVAFGDIHGDYDQYVEALKRNGLVDKKLRWAGGKTHFVQLGDVPDRGPDSRKIIEHLRKLQKQAKRAGGYVHTLIGNHEAMMVYGDLRYVDPGEYKAFTNGGSKKRRDVYINRVLAWLQENRPEETHSREALEKQYPLGYVEHRMAWSPDGEFGRWVASNNTIIQIGDTLFVHGGLSPHQPYQSLKEINAAVREALKLGESTSGENITNSPGGPLWYRGLVTEPAETELAPLQDMLAHYNASRIVIGHTPTGGTIKTRLEGQVVMIDVGMAAHYGANDGNLVIEEGKLFEISADGKRALEVD